jgi:hypothetical protein
MSPGRIIWLAVSVLATLLLLWLAYLGSDAETPQTPEARSSATTEEDETEPQPENDEETASPVQQSSGGLSTSSSSAITKLDPGTLAEQWETLTEHVRAFEIAFFSSPPGDTDAAFLQRIEPFAAPTLLDELESLVPDEPETSLDAELRLNTYQVTVEVIGISGEIRTTLSAFAVTQLRITTEYNDDRADESVEVSHLTYWTKDSGDWRVYSYATS